MATASLRPWPSIWPPHFCSRATTFRKRTSGRPRTSVETHQAPDTVLQRTPQAALLHSVVMAAILEADRPKLDEPLFAPCLRPRWLSDNSDEY